MEPKQPTHEEFESLRHWERRMVITFLVAVIGLLTTVGFDLFIGLAPGLDTTLLVVLGLIVLYGGRLQFSERCPGCGVRIGFQTRLLLPARCRRCGIPFREGARDDASTG